MPRPLHVQFIAEPELARHVTAHQFVDNDPVVNALDGLAGVIQLAAALLDVGNVGNADSEHPFGGEEIWQRLLAIWINLEQYHVLRAMGAQDGAAEQRMVAFFRQAAEEMAERGIQIVNPLVCGGEQRLESIQGREALYLDQLGLPIPGAVCDQAEIGLHKKRMRRFLRNPESFRYRGFGSAVTLGVAFDLLD